VDADAHHSKASDYDASKRWAAKLSSFAQHILVGLGFLAMFAGASALAHDWTDVPLLPAIPPLVLGWCLVVLVHELGHFAGARAAGMIPFAVGIPGLLAWRTSIGWRLRPNRGMQGAAGFVMVHFRADRPFKQQAMLLIVAGPVANMLSGSALCALSPSLPAPLFAYTLALGVFNVLVGVANLLPSRSRLLDNDGLMLLRWLRGEFETGPERAMMEMNALSVSGVQAKDLPERLLRQVGEYPVVGPLLAMWFRLVAFRSAEQWAAVAGLSNELESHLQASPADKRLSLERFVAQMRAEIAFAAAMETKCHGSDEALSISDELDWYFPALRPRCEALRAALIGDAMKTDRLLRESAHKMRRSIDLAHVRSEMHLRECIERLVAEPGLLAGK
jgi:Zn-dependent protease